MSGQGSQQFGTPKVSRFELPQMSAEGLNFVHSQGLMYEAEEAMRCLREGLIETPAFSSAECLKVMQIVSEIRAHIRSFAGDHAVGEPPENETPSGSSGH
jgi:hypothetical protein